MRCACTAEGDRRAEINIMRSPRPKGKSINHFLVDPRSVSLMVACVFWGRREQSGDEGRNVSTRRFGRGSFSPARMWSE